MSQLSRIAVGTVQPDADQQSLVWALYSVLRDMGVHVQSFLSQSRFVALDGAVPLTGQTHRHLDSWMMSPDVCRALFGAATRFCDLAVVEGTFDVGCPGGPRGGSLDTLCDWLDMPRIAILDVSHLDTCRRPTLPPAVDGILLDRVADQADLYRWQLTLETLYGVPVLGGLEKLPSLRSRIREMPAGTTPSMSFCQALGRSLAQTLRIPQLVALAAARGPLPATAGLERPPAAREPLHIAIAYDEAFCCYFPDTLDLLESSGATLSVFSPLSSDCLPAGVDVVYFGCGNLLRFAERLSKNCCLHQALRRHVAGGGRVYAECAGWAYLSREFAVNSQLQLPMVGLLPGCVQANASGGAPRPLEITLAHDCWLAAKSTRLRGYFNPYWSTAFGPPLPSLVAHPTEPGLLVRHGSVIASRMHLNFAAQPSLLQGFFSPVTSGDELLVAPGQTADSGAAAFGNRRPPAGH